MSKQEARKIIDSATNSLQKAVERAMNDKFLKGQSAIVGRNGKAVEINGRDLIKGTRYDKLYAK